MVIDRILAASLYSNLFDWLIFYAPGGRCSKTKLREYQKKMWGPILKRTKQIQGKNPKSKDEIRFLQLIFLFEQYKNKNDRGFDREKRVLAI